VGVNVLTFDRIHVMVGRNNDRKRLWLSSTILKTDLEAVRETLKDTEY